MYEGYLQKLLDQIDFLHFQHTGGGSLLLFVSNCQSDTGYGPLSQKQHFRYHITENSWCDTTHVQL